MRFGISTAALLLTFATTTAFVRGASQAHAAPEIKWGPAPAIFPPGAQMAVMQGDPSSATLFTVRLRMPDGYKIPPHTHPTDEHVTVISGHFHVGMGKTFAQDGMLTLPAGGFITAPAKEAHYASTQGATVVQVHAMGPFAMTYVNPADTPKAAAK
jgi:quercetin dioxygenase-like cupin family protein